MKRVIPLRLRAAWHVVRGRPLMFGVSLEGGFWLAPGSSNVFIASVTIERTLNTPARVTV